MSSNPYVEPISTPEPVVLPLVAQDGARAELILLSPRETPKHVLFWIPAMGVPAKHYLPLAEGLVERGIGVALHEWRGIGSSDRRAGRQVNWGYRELVEMDLPASMAAAREHWPRANVWVGGHSLGGQFACMFASSRPQAFAGIALVASGSPYWRSYRWGCLLALSFFLAPLVTRIVGHLPGRRLRFAGNEARGVIDDWARSGRTGQYTAKGSSTNFERQLAALGLPVLALRMHDDWLGPSSSIDWLLGKMPVSSKQSLVIDENDMDGQAADHFTWMKYPAAVVARLADWIDEQSHAPR